LSHQCQQNSRLEHIIDEAHTQAIVDEFLVGIWILQHRSIDVSFETTLYCQRKHRLDTLQEVNCKWLTQTVCCVHICSECNMIKTSLSQPHLLTTSRSQKSVSFSLPSNKSGPVNLRGDPLPSSSSCAVHATRQTCATCGNGCCALVCATA